MDSIHLIDLITFIDSIDDHSNVFSVSLYLFAKVDDGIVFCVHVRIICISNHMCTYIDGDVYDKYKKQWHCMKNHLLLQYAVALKLIKNRRE